MIARGSIRFILPGLILAIILLFLYLPLSIVAFIITLYFIWFFRDPNREIEINSSLIYAAADGRIVELSQTKDVLKIAIRMSPFDVHINRAPAEGIVTKIQYDPGKHQSVYFAGAEEKNERNLIVIENDLLQIDVLQITGAFARRIECWISENENINQGQKIGMIRFGSQTNIVLHKRQTKEVELKPLIKEDQSVKAGLTAIVKIEVTK